MDEEKTYEEIEMYLHGEMDDQAMAAFEQRLQSNEKLANRVLFFKNIDTALSNQQTVERQRQIENIGKTFFPANEKEASIRNIPFYRKPLSIAAMILFLVVAGILWWQSNNAALTKDKLFAAYYTVYPLSDVMRGGNDPSNPYQKAIEQYQSKEFANSATSFQLLLNEKPEDIPATFGLAQALLNNEPPQLELAMLNFQQVIDDGNSPYVPKAQWYLALIYLKKGELESAKILLENIKGLDNDAAQLLKELR